MSVDDWNFFSYNLPGVWSEDRSSAVVASGGGGVSLGWETTEGNNSWIGYMYNGDDIAEFPSKYVRISAAMRNTGEAWNRSGANGWGTGLVLGFSPNLLSGTIGSSSILDAVVTRFYPGLSRLLPFKPGNGDTTPGSNPSGYSYHTVPFVDNSFIQFETMLVVNSLFADNYTPARSDQPGGEARLWTRWNTGSSLTMPGSAGWTGWSKTWSIPWTTWGAGMHQEGYTTGFYPFFGGIASDWTSGTAYAYFDYITVSYGSEIV